MFEYKVNSKEHTAKMQKVYPIGSLMVFDKEAIFHNAGVTIKSNLDEHHVVAFKLGPNELLLLGDEQGTRVTTNTPVDVLVGDEDNVTLPEDVGIYSQKWDEDRGLYFSNEEDEDEY